MCVCVCACAGDGVQGVLSASPLSVQQLSAALAQVLDALNASERRHPPIALLAHEAGDLEESQILVGLAAQIAKRSMITELMKSSICALVKRSSFATFSAS